jgi:hypothetical protein
MVLSCSGFQHAIGAEKSQIPASLFRALGFLFCGVSDACLLEGFLTVG